MNSSTPNTQSNGFHGHISIVAVVLDSQIALTERQAVRIEFLANEHPAPSSDGGSKQLRQMKALMQHGMTLASIEQMMKLIESNMQRCRTMGFWKKTTFGLNICLIPGNWLAGTRSTQKSLRD